MFFAADVLLEAFRALGFKNMHYSRCEDLLTHLIYQGYVKGYVAHKQQILVLSKLEPFPKLSDLFGKLHQKKLGPAQGGMPAPAP